MSYIGYKQLMTDIKRQTNMNKSIFSGTEFLTFYCDCFRFTPAAVAHWLERLPREREVVGSIPDRVIQKTL